MPAIIPDRDMILVAPNRRGYGLSEPLPRGATRSPISMALRACSPPSSKGNQSLESAFRFNSRQTCSNLMIGACQTRTFYPKIVPVTMADNSSKHHFEHLANSPAAHESLGNRITKWH